MGQDSPPPPTPREVDLTHYRTMPLDVGRLRDSGIASQGIAEAFRCHVLLLCAAWHQHPAGSLPNDAPTLARLAGLGRDLKGWRKIAGIVLRDFREFADGRLYHRVLSEKVIESWNSTRKHKWGLECDRIRKENAARDKKGQRRLEYPPKPAPAILRWPDECPTQPNGTPPEATNFPPEKRLKESEGKDSSTESTADARPKASGTAAQPAPLDASDAMREQLAELAKSKRMGS